MSNQIMPKRRTTLVATAVAAAAGALLVVPLGAAAQADEDPPTTAPDAPPRDAPDEAPAGETPPRPERSAVDRVEDLLGTLVAAGTITQDQADAVLAAIEDARPSPREGGGRLDHHRPGGPTGRWGAGLDTAADVIGIGEDELRDELRDGQSLAEIAEANGIDVQTVIDALAAEAAARLDDAVADGRLDGAEAADRKDAVAARIAEMVEHGFPGRFEGRGPGPWDRWEHSHDPGDDTEEPDTTATTDATDPTSAPPATTDAPATSDG